MTWDEEDNAADQIRSTKRGILVVVTDGGSKFVGNSFQIDLFLGGMFSEFDYVVSHDIVPEAVNLYVLLSE